jgi:NTP pyrophosphatase (non-canonical NTP hydrolase)
MTSRETAGHASLNQYAEKIREIWGDQDTNRSMHDIWLHVIRHASGIAEEVRRDRPVEILEQLSHFVLWALTFVRRAYGPLGVKQQGERAPEESLFRVRYQLSDIVWNKYPRCCPVCVDLTQSAFSTRSCRCPLDLRETIEERYKAITEEEQKAKKKKKRQRIDQLRRYARAHVKRRPKSADGFQRMFEDIFRANIEQESLASIAFHLLEEVGEVGDALLELYTFHKLKPDGITGEEFRWRQTELEDEVADIFSWVFALIIKLDRDRVNVRTFLTKFRPLGQLELLDRPIRLSEILWWTYGSNERETLWCKHCKDKGGVPCKCDITFLSTSEKISKIVPRLELR